MGFAEELRAEVREFTWGPFALGRDVDRLELVYRAGAPEATVLYASRILEATSTHALERAGLESTSNLYATLTTLEDLGFLGEYDWYVGHVLRRLGNAVRHVSDVTDGNDAEIVTVLLGAWLDYVFVRYALGPRLPSLSAGGGSWPPVGGSHVPRLLRDLERFVHGAPDLAPRAFDALAAPGSSRTPGLRALVALAVEALIGRKQLEAASRLLDQGLADAPDDLRLTQLLALHASRRGDLEAAAAVLEPLASVDRVDEETAGILAGVHKRAARRDDDPARLRRAERLYLKGWKSSGRQNAYLGLNAATAALCLGEEAVARDRAERVRALLATREAAVRRAGVDTHTLPYWTQVMAAEAALLVGEVEDAANRYRIAFARHGTRTGDIETTSLQADEVLRAQGRPDTLADLL